MKTMSLCSIAFALLLALVASGDFDSSPAGAYLLIFIGAAAWALLMWHESGLDEVAGDTEGSTKGDGEEAASD